MNKPVVEADSLKIWVDRYLEVSRQYLSTWESSPEDAFLDLPDFLDNRASLLTIIEKTRHRIAINSTDLQNHDSYATALREIINLDGRIMDQINRSMKETELKLLELRKGSRLIASYRQEQPKDANVDVQR